MDDSELRGCIEAMLSEDVGSGDVTSAFTPNRKITAVITADSDGVVSGVQELKFLFRAHRIRCAAHVADGTRVKAGKRVFTLRGRARDILPVERTALNLVSRMSAVATLTRRYSDRLKALGSKSRIVATRKTTPLLRMLEKKAVVAGGGLPHRMGLYDMVLIKDNHLMLFGGDVRAAVAKARASAKGLKVEVEVESVGDALAAASAGADLVMFDNMRPADIRRAIALIRSQNPGRKVVFEVSGGVTLENLGRYASLGADWISTGKITHSAPNVDFSMSVI